MKISLPAQLRGPECRHVMTQVVQIRRLLEPWFLSRNGHGIDELVIVLRVDGSLGSFGAEGVGNIQQANKTLECELVIADEGWASLSDVEIREILRSRIVDATVSCFESCGIPFSRAELDEFIVSST